MLQQSEIITDRIVQLNKTHRLKYDKCVKWIETLNTKDKWVRMTGYLPSYELLLWDFAIKHTAKAELKSAHDVIEKIAEAEKLVSEFGKAIGKELDECQNKKL